MELAGGNQLDVDAWELEDELVVADTAERDGAPGAALVAYEHILPLWRGEALADVPYADWAGPPRLRWCERYTAAALRERANSTSPQAQPPTLGRRRSGIAAEPTCEAAYRVLARARLADGDLVSARRAIDQCRIALAQLDAEPGPLTIAVLAAIADRETDVRAELDARSGSG